MRIYVGNLSREVTEEDLRQAFEAFGAVSSAAIIKDKSSMPRGFGFVEMPTTAEADSAINGLSGKALKGRALNVGEAHPLSGGRGRGRRSE